MSTGTLPKKLGDLGVVEKTFAQQKLVPMAGMRHVLVHQYADLNPARVHAVLAGHLEDIEEFLRQVGVLLDNPERLGLTLQ